MDGHSVALGLPAVLLGAPLVLGAVGLFRRRGERRASPGAQGPLIAVSAVLYALAFNLVFIVQELFLVIPKALTPGLKPVLFHNNHDWSGHHPLENLFQGTGALACVVLGLGLAAWLAGRPPRSATLRLFLTWVVFHSFLESLPQVVVGAFLPANDVGRAMDFFHMSQAAKNGASLLAIIAIAAACLWLAPRFRAFGPLWRTVSLPAALGVLLVLPSRVPGAIDQVLIVPIAVALIGVLWVQADAWRVRPAEPAVSGSLSLVWPVALALAQLAVFQLVLRPGVRFY